MTPEEKKLYALMAVAEQQQDAVKQAIQALNETQDRIQNIIAAQTKATVSGALEDGLKQGSAKMVETANKLNSLNQSIQRSTDLLSWKLIALCGSGIFALVMSLMVFFVVMMPSLDEIQQRRADLKQLKEYPLQVRKSDGQTLVKIMTKKCYSLNGSKVYDWCEIDPKQY